MHDQQARFGNMLSMGPIKIYIIREHYGGILMFKHIDIFARNTLERAIVQCIRCKNRRKLRRAITRHDMVGIEQVFFMIVEHNKDSYQTSWQGIHHNLVKVFYHRCKIGLEIASFQRVSCIIWSRMNFHDKVLMAWNTGRLAWNMQI
jgi:hypothetical protein